MSQTSFDALIERHHAKVFGDRPARAEAQELDPDIDPFAKIPGVDGRSTDELFTNPDDWKPERKKCFVKEKEGIFRRKTKELYEKDGYTVYDVGFWFSFWKEGHQVARRSDLFGCFDMEAYKGLETIGIQFTSKDNLGAHVTKMCSHKPASAKDATHRSVYMRRWLTAGRRIQLVGWDQPGGFKTAYVVTIRELTLEMMDAHEPRTRIKK